MAEKREHRNKAVEKIFGYVRDNYGTEPEYPWIKSPEYAVLRHSSNRKWYGLIMEVNGRAFGLDDRMMWVINLKVSPQVHEIMTAEGTAFPAYHMNKKKWISVPLEESAAQEVLYDLIDESYELTK